MTEQTTPGHLGYTAVADELLRVARALRKADLDNHPAPVLAKFELTPARGDDQVTTERVDALGLAILDKVGTTNRFGDGTYVHGAAYLGGPVWLSVTGQISGPPDARDREIAQLRARVAELEPYAPRENRPAPVNAVGPIGEPSVLGPQVERPL